MKRVLPLLSCLLLLTFTGCSAGDIDRLPGSSKLTIEGVTYRTGFYGDLSPQFGQVGMIGTESLQKEYLSDDDGKYQIRRVQFEGHNWVHSYMGGNTGLIYCAEDEWEETRNYYEAPDNFDTYLGLGHYVMEESVKLPEIDLEKLDELMVFGEENDYNPFGKYSNEKILEQARRLPEEEYHGGFYFYRASKDGYFTTGSGSKYFIHDGKLLLVFYHDGGRKNGGKKEVVVVDVPDELGQYFINLIEQYLN